MDFIETFRQQAMGVNLQLLNLWTTHAVKDGCHIQVTFKNTKMTTVWPTLQTEVKI